MSQVPQDLEQLRSALTRARLEKEQYKSSLTELQNILDLCRVISSSQDLKDILNHLLYLLGEILPSRGCAVYLGEGPLGPSGGSTGDEGLGGRGRHVPILTRNLTPQLQQVLDQHFEEGIIRWILKERRVCIVPSFDDRSASPAAKPADTASAGGDAEADPAAGDYAVIPLSDNDSAYGFIWIASNLGHEQVTPETTNLIWVLSSQASVAIVNCLHRKRMEEKINEMRILTSVSALKGEILRQGMTAGEKGSGNLPALYAELQKLAGRELKLEGGLLLTCPPPDESAKPTGEKGSDGSAVPPIRVAPPHPAFDAALLRHADLSKLMRLADRELVRLEAGDFFRSAYPALAAALGSAGVAMLSLSPHRGEEDASGENRAGSVYLLLPLSTSDLQRLPAFQNLLPALVSQARVVAENMELYDSLLAANRNLTALQWQLVHSGKMAALGQLAGGVAHEINNPLQIMLGRIQMIQMMAEQQGSAGGAQARDKLKDELYLVTEEILRIRDIVKNLLDFSRQGGRESSFAPVSLNDTLRDVLALLHHQLQSSQVEVKLELDPANPRLLGNRNQLKQVFINLLVNAVHAMEQDPKVLEVKTRVRAGAAEAVIRDSGVGIPQENLHRIFEPFYTTKSMGTGLGLSISYGIVKDHKGNIEVESQESSGTSFTVSIPRLSEDNMGYNLLVG